MTLALKATGISKDFPVGDESVRVLFDVAVDIRLKELTMLVGPSGCGKTTLISILSGILSASAGDIWVMGKHLTAMRDREKVLLRRHNIGFVFQQFNLLPALTAAENAAIPLVADGMEMARATARTESVSVSKRTGTSKSKSLLTITPAPGAAVTQRLPPAC